MFLRLRFVFLLSMHFLICCKSIVDYQLVLSLAKGQLQLQRLRPIDQTPDIPGSDKNVDTVQIWHPGGATFIICKFGYFVLVVNMVNSWRFLQKLQIWLRGGPPVSAATLATCLKSSSASGKFHLDHHDGGWSEVTKARCKSGDSNIDDAAASNRCQWRNNDDDDFGDLYPIIDIIDPDYWRKRKTVYGGIDSLLLLLWHTIV